MSDTKERIWMTALRLFAQDGYEAVSVSRIAGELGMTKGALYKHYKSKRDIFDCIVARMIQTDRERAQEYHVPEEPFSCAAESYQQTELESIKQFTIAQYSYWTRDEIACSFRKMLALEQYRNAEMNELYQSCLISGPVQYMEDLFRTMTEQQLLRKVDPRQLAIEFFAPLLLLIQMSDANDSCDHAETVLSDFVDRFFTHYAR